MPPKRPTVPCPEQLFKPQKSVKTCSACGDEFGITRWRHNCFMCGDVVCDDCSKHRLTLPPVHVAEPVRVCSPCWPNATALGGKAPSGGRVLGGAATEGGPASSAPETPEERRAKLAAAMAARQAPKATPAKKAPHGPKPANPAPRPVAPGPAASAPAPETVLVSAPSTSLGSEVEAPSERGPSSETVAGATPSDDPVAAAPHGGAPSAAERLGAAATNGGGGEPANPVLAAALRRKAEEEARSGRPQSSTVDPQKVALLQQVRAKLAAKGMEEPFGLQGFDRGKLQTYLHRLSE